MGKGCPPTLLVKRWVTSSHHEEQCAGSLRNGQESEIRILPNRIHKNKLQKIKDLNKRTDNMKLLREKAEHTLTQNAARFSLTYVLESLKIKQK